MKLLSTHSFTRNYKLAALLSYLGLLVSLYIFYYLYTDFSYYQSQGISLIAYFSDSFGDRLLPLILALVFIAAFAYYANKRTLVYRNEYVTYIEILPDENKAIKHHEITKLKYLHGKKTVLSAVSNKFDFLDNLDKLRSFREEAINTNSSTSYSVSGVSGSVNYPTGTALVMTKTKHQKSTAYKIIAEFTDNTEKEISYGDIRASKFYEIFNVFVQ